MLNRDELSKILFLYLGWYVLLYVILYTALLIVPLKFGFLGGKLSEYLNTPHIWAFINFDGEHYLSIAKNGYKDLQHFYFPFYVIMINLVSSVLSIKEAVAGLVVSRISILIALIGMYKLVKIEYNEKIAYNSVLILLLFPTSFYFVSYYTESIFLALVVWSYYFAREGKWLYAGLLGAFSTATRIVGLALIPALAIEFFLQRKEMTFYKKKIALLSLSLIPLGLILYMYYLWQTTGDPLVFYNKVHIFGQQRSSGMTILPQVFYRYIFKIVPAINYDYFPIVFTTFLELTIAVIFTIYSIYSLFKIRISYAVYFIAAFLIPAFSGSFSSLPRYVLIIFPAFLLVAILLDKINRNWRYILYVILFILLSISASMFFRGYWIS